MVKQYILLAFLLLLFISVGLHGCRVFIQQLQQCFSDPRPKKIRVEHLLFSIALTVKTLAAVAFAVLLGNLFFSEITEKEEFPWRSIFLLPAVMVIWWVSWMPWVLARDKRLKRLRQDARYDTRPFFLLLRSFRLESLAITPLMYYDPSPTGVRDQLPRHQWANLIAQALAQLGRTVCIGVTPYQVDAFQWPQIAFLRTSAENWRDVFAAAVADCAAILVILDTSLGVLEELFYIHQTGFYFKTLVFVPPEFKDEYGVTRKRWTDLREQAAKRGISLPEYEPDGMIYAAKADFSVSSCQKHVYFSLSRMRRVVAKVLADSGVHQGKTLETFFREAQLEVPNHAAWDRSSWMLWLTLIWDTIRSRLRFRS